MIPRKGDGYELELLVPHAEIGLELFAGVNPNWLRIAEVGRTRKKRGCVTVIGVPASYLRIDRIQSLHKVAASFQIRYPKDAIGARHREALAKNPPRFVAVQVLLLHKIQM